MNRAVATRQQSEVPAPAQPPRLPEPIRKAIADPFVFDGGEAPPWELPAVLPAEKDIALALSLLKASLAPTSVEFMITLLKALGVVTNTRGTDADTWRQRFAEYSKALCRYPADIAASVIESMKRTEEWFPALGKLDKAMGAELIARRRQIDRLEAMLKAAQEPAKDGPPKLCDMAPADRLRTMLATYRSVYGDGHPRTIGCERDLAKVEGRAPEAWAKEG